MPHIAPALWEGPAFVLALAAVPIALAWFLWGGPDRSDRLSARYGRYVLPGLAIGFAAATVMATWQADWGNVAWGVTMTLFWLLQWRRARREAAKPQ